MLLNILIVSVKQQEDFNMLLFIGLFTLTAALSLSVFLLGENDKINQDYKDSQLWRTLESRILETKNN